MKTKVIKSLLTIACLLCSMQMSAYSFEVDGIYYNIVSYVEKTCEVTSGDTKYSGDVEIPDNVTCNGETWTVTSIGDYAFSGCSGLTSVTIGNSVMSIGEYAFSECKGLTSVTIPNSVTNIEKLAFSDCTALEKLVIEDGNEILKLGDNILSNCPLKSLYLGRIYDGGSPFEKIWGKNTTLAEVIIGNSVTSIGERAFEGCSGLTSVIIGNSVTSIGRWAFRDCSSLTSVIIGNSVTSIGFCAFYGCSGLTSVTIPNSVTSIGQYAFTGCTSLEKLIIEDGDETLVLEANDYECRQGLFYDCPLKSLYLGRNLSYGYDSSPFKNTLTEVSIGNSVTSIGGYAFLGCSGLTSITIPNSVTSIGNLAFYGCSGLTSVTIPTSVTSIGNNAFKDCAALEKLIIEDGQETLKLGDNGWRSGLFYDCPLKYLYLGRNVSYDYSPFPNKPTLTEVSIGNTVTTIEKSAFSGSSSLTSVTIPNSVTTIGESAFSGCSGLISIGIPNSVTVIGGGAFSGCSGLTGITIPNSVTSIENDAFKGCTALEKFIIEDGTETLKLGSNYNDCPLKYLYLGRNYIGVLPSDNKSTLTEVGIGNLVTSIGGRVFDGCTALEKLTIEDGDEILELADLKFSNCPLKYLYIGRKLSDYSFNNKPTLTEVGIGNSVINIVDGMFEGCSGLTGITIPNSVTSIGNGAFNGCAALEKLIIEDGNDTLTLGYNYKGGGYFPGKGLFYDCPLKCLYLGRTLSYPNTKYEGYSPFYNISTLTEMSIGNSVTSIGNYAFNGCTGLTSVTIPNSVTGIEESAFRDCSGLTSVTIGNSVAGIGSSAFRGCSGLTSVTIPNSVTSIKGWVFGECSSLATIYSFNPIPPGAYNSSFNPLFESAILYVPNEAVETYKATFPWNKFRKIQSFDQTGIYGVEADDNSRQDVYYDLNGHRLSTSKKGLNIINGKKVIIK